MNPPPESVTQSGCSGGCCGSGNSDPMGELQVQAPTSSAFRNEMTSNSELGQEARSSTNIPPADGEKMSAERAVSTDKCNKGCCGPKSDDGDVVASMSKGEDSCCSPSRMAKTTTTTPSSVQDVDGTGCCTQEKLTPTCHEPCCSSKGDASEKMDELVTKESSGPDSQAAVPSSCESDACCTGNGVTTRAEQSVDECCGDRNAESGQRGCGQALKGDEDCCGPKPGPTQEDDVPFCCQGKTKPCCDSEYFHKILCKKALCLQDP